MQFEKIFYQSDKANILHKKEEKNSEMDKQKVLDFLEQSPEILEKILNAMKEK